MYRGPVFAAVAQGSSPTRGPLLDVITPYLIPFPVISQPVPSAKAIKRQKQTKITCYILNYIDIF